MLALASSFRGVVSVPLETKARGGRRPDEGGGLTDPPPSCFGYEGLGVEVTGVDSGILLPAGVAFDSCESTCPPYTEIIVIHG